MPAADRGAARIKLVDAARGIALVGMFAYHFTWDLGFYGLIDGSLPLSPAFKAYAHAVAATFLLLVGISLVLAERAGATGLQHLRRIAIVAAAAAGITLATFYLFPGEFIFFGILHCIAVSSLIGWALLRAPTWLVACVMSLALIAPARIAAPGLDAPVLAWLGLGAVAPPTLDYRPLFPWLGIVLAGLVAARLALSRGNGGAWARWSPRTPAGRLLVLGGRHSLPVYLVHQPLFLGMLFLVTQATRPAPEPGATFLRACEMQCGDAGPDVQACGAGCLCLANRLKQGGLWSSALAGRLSPDQRRAVDRFARACGADPSGP